MAEKHGLIYVHLAGDGPIDVDEQLSGAQDDLADFSPPRACLLLPRARAGRSLRALEEVLLA